MALYKHKQYLNDSDHGAFDLIHRPAIAHQIPASTGARFAERR